MRKLTLVFAATLVLFGCKKNETTSATSATQTTATTASTAAPPAAQPEPVPAAAPATASVAPTTGAIASSEGETAGAHVDITELKRTSGATVTLKLTVSNGSDKEMNMYSEHGFGGDGNLSKDAYRDMSGIHLLDPVNKKKYFVMTDSEKHCVCSKDIAEVRPGSKINLWAKFPAPPPEVQKVTIEIPHFQPIEDVPISQ